MPGFENIVVWIIMACAVAGAIAAIVDSESELGKQFTEGLHSIGPIFIPVAGIMASIPYLSRAVEFTLGPAFVSVGADPAIAATSVIAVDMGGYQLAGSLAAGRAEWILAMIVGYMAGATIIFSIPVGLAMLDKREHKYLALGMMAGILSIPIGVAASSLLIVAFSPQVRGAITTTGDAGVELQMSLGQIAVNLLPLVLFVTVIAAGLRWVPDLMIRLFIFFARAVDAGIKLVLVCCIVEYFTKAFSTVLSQWGLAWEFAPIIADEKDQFRALEIAGYIGLMLAGAFPMVYLIRQHLKRPVEAVGRKIGLKNEGAAGLLATSANILVMYRLVPDMRPRDKVVNIAFAVCAAFLFGDHLAFTANFQPTLVLPIMAGKLIGGIAGILLAVWLSVPRAIALAETESQQQGD